VVQRLTLKRLMILSQTAWADQLLKAWGVESVGGRLGLLDKIAIEPDPSRRTAYGVAVEMMENPTIIQYNPRVTAYFYRKELVGRPLGADGSRAIKVFSLVSVDETASDVNWYGAPARDGRLGTGDAMLGFDWVSDGSGSYHPLDTPERIARYVDIHGQLVRSAVYGASYGRAAALLLSTEVGERDNNI
jgi:hypothetical protein